MTDTITSAERIEALMQIHPKGFDLSLGRITELLEKLGNPHRKLPPVLHFAGTNGKGSAIAFCRAILEAHGLAVHVHTSPHLVNWSERYRLGQKDAPGILVDDAILSDAIRRVAEANGGRHITVFEVLSAVTFLLFSEHPADVCLIEVGLGGRFDATNVMEETAVSIITPVSLDHEAYLGDTVAKIAFEKAGIIKPSTPVVVGPQGREALSVIEKQAGKLKAPIEISGEGFRALREDGRLVFSNEERLMDLPVPSLSGDHQIDNAATAIAACLRFAKTLGLELDNDRTGNGLRRVEWPARMQRLTKGAIVQELLDIRSDPTPLIWLDGGHNPGAGETVARFFTQQGGDGEVELIIVCGMLTTKDPAGYFDHLRPLKPKILAVPITSSEAGFAPDHLADHARRSGLEAQSFDNLEMAIEQVAEMIAATDKGIQVLFAGSLYLAGDVLALNGTPPE